MPQPEPHCGLCAHCHAKAIEAQRRENEAARRRLAQLEGAVLGAALGREVLARQGRIADDPWLSALDRHAERTVLERLGLAQPGPARGALVPWIEEDLACREARAAYERRLGQLRQAIEAAAAELRRSIGALLEARRPGTIVARALCANDRSLLLGVR